VKHEWKFCCSIAKFLCFNSFDVNPTTRHTFFSVLIGGFFYWASLLCVNQSSVQKAMSLRSLSKARIALTLSVFLLVAVFLMNFYTGLMSFAKYETCDPVGAGKLDAIDQLVPFYVMETFGDFTTFVGIFVAGIFAASLGTVAACLSSLSAVTIEDLLVSGLNIKITPAKSIVYAKWMNFGYGVLSFGLIFLIEGRSVLQATLTLNGLIGGIILGLFCLGIFFKKANLKGALYGGLLSTLCVITLGIFALSYNEDEPFLPTSTEGCNCRVDSTPKPLPPADSGDPWYAYIYQVSYMWYSMIGTILTIVLGLIISFITQLYDDWRIERITHKENRPEKFSPKPFNESRRKISTIVQNLGQDMKQSTAKLENKICEVITATMHNENEVDRMKIINEETLQVGENRENVSVIGIFDGRSGGIDNQGLEINEGNSGK
jgi:Na+/proline symporter